MAIDQEPSAEEGMTYADITARLKLLQPRLGEIAKRASDYFEIINEFAPTPLEVKGTDARITQVSSINTCPHTGAPLSKEVFTTLSDGGVLSINKSPESVSTSMPVLSVRFSWPFNGRLRRSELHEIHELDKADTPYTFEVSEYDQGSGRHLDFVAYAYTKENAKYIEEMNDAVAQAEVVAGEYLINGTTRSRRLASFLGVIETESFWGIPGDPERIYRPDLDQEDSSGRYVRFQDHGDGTWDIDFDPA